MTDRRAFLHWILGAITGCFSAIMGSALRAAAEPRFQQPATGHSPYGRLADALRADPDYAWSWHCNIAVAAMDEGVSYAVANRAAARLMVTAFGIDTSRDPRFSDADVA